MCTSLGKDIEWLVYSERRVPPSTLPELLTLVPFFLGCQNRGYEEIEGTLPCILNRDFPVVDCDGRSRRSLNIVTGRIVLYPLF